MTTAVLAAAIALGAGATASGASSDEAALEHLTNADRAGAGLPALRVCADLESVARRWAQRMAASGELAHNPSYPAQVGGWQRVAENVGTGMSVAAIERAFLASPGHRAHVLSHELVEVGVGTARADGGRIWTSVLFRTPSGSGCAPSPRRALARRAAVATSAPTAARVRATGPAAAPVQAAARSSVAAPPRVAALRAPASLRGAAPSRGEAATRSALVTATAAVGAIDPIWSQHAYVLSLAAITGAAR